MLSAAWVCPHRLTADMALLQRRSGVTWPDAFKEPGTAAAAGAAGAAVGPVLRPAGAVTPLGADEIWCDLAAAAGGPAAAGGLDMMGPDVFTLSEGVLGLGMRADPDANPY